MTAPNSIGLSERDQKILDLGDENFIPFSWDTLKEIIGKYLSCNAL